MLTIMAALVLFPVMALANPATFSGTYGGQLIITVHETYPLPGQDMGGEATLSYRNFSQIPGLALNGDLEVGFSLLASVNLLWIDFEGGQSLTLINLQNGESYSVTIPKTFSFLLDLTSLQCKDVESFEGGTPLIMLNSQPIPVTCEIYPYLVKLK